MLQVEGGPDFFPATGIKQRMGRKVRHVFGTLDNISTIPPPPFSNRYGSKLWEKLGQWIGFFFVSSMFFGTFLGATWCSPKTPKQHLKHCFGGRRGWQVKSLELNCSYDFEPSFDPKIKWWIFKILLHVGTISKQG